MGFNTIRKHIKVEPALYYYYADSLGLMLWQDMPSGFAVQEKATAHVKANAPEDWNRPAESARQWETELKTMIDHLRFFPSIVTWVVFNEGWGQYETPRVVNWVKEYDTTRLINGVSGWADRKVGDMFDIHNYPGAAMDPMSNIQDRIQVLGEFGGLGLVVPGHIWNPDMRNWGYKNMDQGTALLNDYGRLMFDLQPLIKAGLSAAIYTQTTDVEGEVNGLMTYDREVVKLPFQLARMFHHGLYSAKPEKEILLVKDARMGESFKQVATDGVNFQRAKMPLAVAPGQTVTSVAQFSLDRVPEVLSLQVRMKNAVKVWLNGQLVLDLTGSRITRSSNNYNISDFIQYLKPGQNELRIENVNDNKAGEFDYSLFAF